MVANIVQVATRLITVPVVIHHLGLGGYGIWNVIMMTATYMRFGSVGVKTAFQKYVAEATGSGEYERANELLSTGSAIMLVISTLGLIPVAFFSRDIARLSGVPPEFLKSAATSISLLAVIMLMSNVGAAFESIVMGGHRIDLLRKFAAYLSIGEACGIIAVMTFGYGLAALSMVIGASELIYLTSCYIASNQIVPQIRVRMCSVKREALREFFRFAGSYQLVNLLDVAYNSLIPVSILSSFGAELAGVYAVVTRVVGSAAMLQDSFLAPILSAGAMVFASGNASKVQALLSKAFKVTLGLSLFPLGFITIFGQMIAYAWTGQVNQDFRSTFMLVCARSLFIALSTLGLVLYRATGKVVLDNMRQVFRVAVIVALLLFSRRLGFVGVLSGLALCELAGVFFILYAMGKTFEVFKAKHILPGMIRISAASVLILAIGMAVYFIPLPEAKTARIASALKLVEVGMACVVVTWPLLLKTGSIDEAEKRAILGSLFPGHSSPTA